MTVPILAEDEGLLQKCFAFLRDFVDARNEMQAFIPHLLLVSNPRVLNSTSTVKKQKSLKGFFLFGWVSGTRCELLCNIIEFNDHELEYGIRLIEKIIKSFD